MISLCLWKWKAWRIYIILQEGLLQKQEAVPKKAVEISDAWSGALASVLKSVPVYDYSLKKSTITKLMPIENNKIEGYSQDKVLYIERG